MNNSSNLDFANAQKVTNTLTVNARRTMNYLVLSESFCIPTELRERPQFVVWEALPDPEHAEQKPKKIPINPKNEKPASTTNPDTWGTYDEAVAAFNNNPSLAGIGYVFAKEDPFVGIDLDHCRNAETGKIEEWAQKIINDFNSYTEVSPSGTGVHILIQGERGEGGNRKGDIEIYDKGRYFTLTGDRVPDTANTVEKRQEALGALVVETFGQPEPASVPTVEVGEAQEVRSDEEVVEKARRAANGEKFKALWEGNWNAYNTQSEADLALCAHLAYWTERSPEQMDRLFRQSGLMRDKWTEKRGENTYGELTIDKAIDGTPPPLTKVERAKEAKPMPKDQLILYSNEATLWKDGDRNGYATITINGHQENWAIESSGFRDFLEYRYYTDTSGSPNRNTTEDALRTIGAKARFEGDTHKPSLRVANHDDAIYIDLANAEWQAVKVTEDGWAVVDNPPVKFLRPEGLQPLPRPKVADGVDGGDLLRRFLNVSNEDDFKLVVGWLVFSFSPHGPYPVLNPKGEKGTAKSTMSRVVRELVDPNTAPLRKTPKNVDDLMMAAHNGWVIALDNLSHLQPWLSDTLCSLTTGTGYGKRRHHKNTEEVLISAQRPVIMNGIPSVATRPDLADRTLEVTLEPISEYERKEEAEFWAEFKEAHPIILGWLLNAVSGALREVHDTELSRKPRLADFAKFVTAAESTPGWEKYSFVSVLFRNRQELNEATVDSHPVAQAVMELMAERDEWEGKASELLTDLTGIKNFWNREPEEWPKRANVLSSKLTEIADSLRSIGIDIRSSNRGRGAAHRKTIVITKVVQDIDPIYPTTDDETDHQEKKNTTPVSTSAPRTSGDTGKVLGTILLNPSTNEKFMPGNIPDMKISLDRDR